MKSGPAAAASASIGGAPSVDFLNSSVPVEAPKSTIGIRKVQPRRGVSVIFVTKVKFS